MQPPEGANQRQFGPEVAHAMLLADQQTGHHLAVSTDPIAVQAHEEVQHEDAQQLWEHVHTVVHEVAGGLLYWD